MDEQNRDWKTEIKYFGLTIDNKLLWKKHEVTNTLRWSFNNF